MAVVAMAKEMAEVAMAEGTEKVVVVWVEVEMATVVVVMAAEVKVDGTRRRSI